MWDGTIVGVFYPIEVPLPFLRHASEFLPITHAAIGMQTGLLGNASMPQRLPYIRILALSGLVAMPFVADLS